MENNSNKQRSFKETRIRNITLVYYSRPDIRKAMFNFSENRECIPQYYEGFGKRPDNFQYESDILEQVRKGATSFHCSEELWHDPLEISTDLSRDEIDDLRIGWDLLLDIDSPYLEYSKIYAKLLVDSLKFYGVKNIGIKFSVSGDTDILIKIKDEIKLSPINEVIELMKNGNNLKVLSLGKDRRLRFSKIYDYLEHKDTLYEICHSQSKIPINATGHHSVFIWEKGYIKQKKVSELKKGDYLISYNCSKNPFVEDKKILSFKYQFSKNQFKKDIIHEKIKLTLQLMRLVGYFLSEGHITEKINQTGFTFNINEKEYIDDCIKLLSSITQRKISIRNPNPTSTQILIHSKKWYDFFKEYCGEKKEKRVPSFIWTLSRKFFLEMLKGYLRGDGYKIDKYEIVAKSVSKRLVKELVWLCKLNGIACTLSSEKNKPHRLPQGNEFPESFVYVLRIPKSEIKLKEFNKNRNKFSPYPRDKVFPVDGLSFVYKKIKPGKFNSHRPEQMTLTKKKANLNRIKKVLDWFNDYRKIEIDEDCKRIIRNYESLFNSDISIVEVKNIVKKGKEKVYDVSVEDTEAFFGNDFPVLLHNSGSKGFHIIIPWKAFPQEIYNQKTKNMFPEWPRIICEYLSEIIKPKLADKIFEDSNLKELARKTGKQEEDLLIRECVSCNRPAAKKFLVSWMCPYCKIEKTMIQKNRRIPRCSECSKELYEKTRREIYTCDFCNLDSNKNPEMFAEKDRFATEKLIDADLVLVAPRHLFRMPYSLHEKTALASIVIDKDKIENFQINDARALKVEIKNFYPNPEPDEAKRLLLEALDWFEQKEKQEKIIQEKKVSLSPKIKNKDFKQITIPDPSIDIFPPQIKLLYRGVKQDGRKRALFILITFLKSLGVPDNELEKRINSWNEKNYKPLKKGYIQSQLNWFARNPKVLPPNFANPIYKDLGVDKPDELVKKTKNPVNYAIKKYFALRR